MRTNGASIPDEVQHLMAQCAQCGWRLSVLSRDAAHARAEVQNGFTRHLIEDHGAPRLNAEKAAAMKSEIATLTASSV